LQAIQIPRWHSDLIARYSDRISRNQITYISTNDLLCQQSLEFGTERPAGSNDNEATLATSQYVLSTIAALARRPSIVECQRYQEVLKNLQRSVNARDVKVVFVLMSDEHRDPLLGLTERDLQSRFWRDGW
jgi:hypothetical protein